MVQARLRTSASRAPPECCASWRSALLVLRVTRDEFSFLIQVVVSHHSFMVSSFDGRTYRILLRSAQQTTIHETRTPYVTTLRNVMLIRCPARRSPNPTACFSTQCSLCGRRERRAVVAQARWKRGACGARTSCAGWCLA